MPDKDKGEDTADYSILYTTQKIKKVKAWAEGTLTHDPSSSRIVLKDDSGTTLTSSHFPKSKTIEVGGEIDHGQYLIQIESLKGEEAALTPAVSSLQNGMQLSGLLKRVSKGYNFGPSRQLVASVSFKDCSEYQKQFMAMLNENLMAELSGLAIRYFFMARERHDNAASAARSNPFSNAKSKRRRVLAGSMAQVCKSVGVLYFDDCT
ncbi:Protein zgrf1, partial [Linderina pennispora]